MPQDQGLERKISLDFARIRDRRWRFCHESGHIAAERLEFLADGTMAGHTHRNERYWRIEDGVLSLLNENGSLTVRFDESSVDDGRLVLQGSHLPNPSIVLRLLEQYSNPITNDSSVSQDARRAVQSFDIFDTLIGRIVLHPTDVFDAVEKAGVIDFKRFRLAAQAASNHTWSDIYARYQHLTGVDDIEAARIQQLELEAEMEASYLISESYQKVRDGDILVSDMYLPRETLAKLLESVGFRKQVEIFVTPNGKASGQIWSVLKKRFDIQLHLGDNLYSDVESPAHHGIASSHYRGTQSTLLEAIIAERGAVSTSNLVKRFRLTNPFPTGTREFALHDAQAQANLPFLLLMAVHLHDIMKSEELTRILFTTRDSCLLQPIFELLFPDTDSHTFYSSRIAYCERNRNFVEYVSRIYIPGRTLIFDLHGAFKSGRDLFEDLFGVLPRVHIFSCSEGRAPDYPGISYDVKRGSNWTETLNLDRVGTVIALDSYSRPIRAPISASLAEVGALYRSIAVRFVESLRPYLDSVRCELLAMDRAVPMPWDDIHRHICERVRNTPAVPVLEATLEHQSLTQLANKALSDKGSTYACAHGYTFIYQHLLHDLAPREHLSILEIGLNRAGGSDIPSLRTWRSYLGSNATLYGLDISPNFLCHHDPTAGIHILVADQSDAASLARCGLVNPLGYDMIIDDGSHISSHQQISLRTLWQFLRPGGIYIIEDLHFQPEIEPIMDTREMLRQWRTGVPAYTPHIGRADSARILGEVSLIELHDSRSQRWGDKVEDALAVIRKQI